MKNALQYINNSENSTNGRYFEDFQLAIVTDIILDESHPFFNKNSTSDIYQDSIYVKQTTLPINYEGKVPSTNDINYSYIGRIKIRILTDEVKTPRDRLPWAIPMDNTTSQYPLLNEYVLVKKINETYYYTKPLNKFNYLGVNGDFNTEIGHSHDNESSKPSNPTTGYKSYLSHPVFKYQNPSGFLGNYFILNPNIRKIKTYEGDTVIESRFGQSIQFSAYDDDRKNDKGKFSTYTLDGNLLKDSQKGGYGNPKLTIRNRQRNISTNSQQLLHPKLPPIPAISEKEKNYGGLIETDINNDGSTIEFSSGNTITKWKTTVYKSIFGNDNNTGLTTEEQQNFGPAGSTSFTFPILSGDQLLLNSDRIILSSRFNETFHFSKKRYSIVTDSEYTVDSNDSMVFTTNQLTAFNSSQIFLGQYGETNEPVLLGQTSVDWLYDLCEWLLAHIHWYNHVHPHPHSHPDAGRISNVNSNNAVPNQTQIPVQQIKLKALRDKLHTLLSRRVYVTGGGYAPGSNGVKPRNSGGECKEPLKINIYNGDGAVGTFKGSNRRENK